MKKIEAVALLAAFLTLAGLSMNWALKGAIHYQKDIPVPDLVGKSLNDALATLADLNLGLKKEGSEFNDQVPAGTILRQQPAPGISVREGKILRVTLSQGGESVYVPDLAGQSLRSAEIALRANSLSLGEVRAQPSLKYEKDVVISQAPAPRTITNKNAFVHLVVSNGPPEDGRALMPDFVGRSWDDVLAWSKESGVSVTRTEDNASQESDRVLQQDVAADTPLDSFKTARFVVASHKSGGPAVPGSAPAASRFRFEVPQGESSKQYSFTLIDSNGSREIWRGSPDPGKKLDIPISGKVGTGARVRIFVNGILTEERSL